MLAASSVLLLAIIGAAAGNGLVCINQRLQNCKGELDVNKLHRITKFPTPSELREICPGVTGYLSCSRKAVRECDYTPPEDSFFTITELDRLTRMVMSLCREGSDMNRKYTRNVYCINTYFDSGYAECVDWKDPFSHSLSIAESFYVDFELTEDERECVMTSFVVQCLMSKISRSCGDEAHSLFNEIVDTTKTFTTECDPEVMEVANSVIRYFLSSNTQYQQYQTAL